MSQPLPQLGDEEELVSRLAAAHRHGKKVVFLVGAPLVAPVRKGEPGVPGVAEMIARVQAALDGEVELPAPEVPGAYQQAFEILNRRRGLPQVNTVVREAVLEACRAEPGLLTAAATGDSEACKTLEGRLDVWEHTPGVRGLGQLIAALPATFGHTLLTSNFDPLIETAIRRAGGLCWQTTLHTDGSLEASEAPGCRAVHVHGFWRGNGDTLHTPLQLSRPRPQLENSLRRLFESTLVVVVAYGGWEDVFTRGLARVVADAGASPEVLWTFYAAGVERVQKNGDAILRLLAPGIQRGTVTLFAGIDCHSFFPALHERLSEPGASGEKPPPGDSNGAAPLPGHPSPFVAGPPITSDRHFSGRHGQRQQLETAVRQLQPTQLLGERRMGKTSLLRWLERHVGAWRKWPVAWINAQGLAGRSPSALVQGAAQALGQSDSVELILGAGDGPGGARAAERALLSLLPAIILVDEASLLAEDGHQFDTQFLDFLRAQCQDGRLLWVSTSPVDLYPLFQSTGLSSKFLNDSRKVWVGQLEPDAATRVLAGHLAPTLVEWVTKETAGFAYGLQWLGDALWRKQAPEAAGDELAEVMRPVFVGWWSRRSPEQRELLRQGAGGLPLASLAATPRRQARALVRMGLLDESSGIFRLPGNAWREFVKDV